MAKRFTAALQAKALETLHAAIGGRDEFDIHCIIESTALNLARTSGCEYASIAQYLEDEYDTFTATDE